MLFTLFYIKWCYYYFTVFNYIMYFISSIYVSVALNGVPAHSRGRAVQLIGLRPLDCWDRGFESR